MSNNATNFAGAVVENMDVFLNTDQFGETVTFFPADGSASFRAVAIVDRTSLIPRDEQHHKTYVEEVSLMIQPFEGIPDLTQFGTALLLPEDDPEANPSQKWDFAERLGEDAASMIVKFRRTKLHRAGFGRAPQI